MSIAWFLDDRNIDISIKNHTTYSWGSTRRFFSTLTMIYSFLGALYIIVLKNQAVTLFILSILYWVENSRQFKQILPPPVKINAIFSEFHRYGSANKALCYNAHQAGWERAWFKMACFGSNGINKIKRQIIKLKNNFHNHNFRWISRLRYSSRFKSSSRRFL